MLCFLQVDRGGQVEGPSSEGSLSAVAMALGSRAFHRRMGAHTKKEDKEKSQTEEKSRPSQTP